jgi:hypothetical protein
VRERERERERVRVREELGTAPHHSTARTQPHHDTQCLLSLRVAHTQLRTALFLHHTVGFDRRSGNGTPIKTSQNSKSHTRAGSEKCPTAASVWAGNSTCLFQVLSSRSHIELISLLFHRITSSSRYEYNPLITLITTVEAERLTAGLVPLDTG